MCSSCVIIFGCILLLRLFWVTVNIYWPREMYFSPQISESKSRRDKMIKCPVWQNCGGRGDINITAQAEVITLTISEITWPPSWPLIGPEWSRDQYPGLWLAPWCVRHPPPLFPPSCCERRCSELQEVFSEEDCSDYPFSKQYLSIVWSLSTVIYFVDKIFSKSLSECIGHSTISKYFNI